jgi:hypothetical protein
MPSGTIVNTLTGATRRSKAQFILMDYFPETLQAFVAELHGRRTAVSYKQAVAILAGVSGLALAAALGCPWGLPWGLIRISEFMGVACGVPCPGLCQLWASCRVVACEDASIPSTLKQFQNCTGGSCSIQSSVVSATTMWL